MLSRPVSASGDILPVLSLPDLLSGPAAAAAGLRDHLSLFSGDWWEYPDRGNEIFDLIALSRRTSGDAAPLCSALISWIQSFPGIRSVSDAESSFSGRLFRFSCTAHTDGGEAVPVSFSA